MTTPEKSEIALRVEKLCKEYPLYTGPGQMAFDRLGIYRRLPKFLRPKIPTHRALDNISFEVKAGERVGVVGRNGAGKTTLLRLIARSFDPTSGRIDVNGKVHSLMQTGIGFDPEFTGLENIRAAAVWSGLDEAEAKAVVDDVVDFCELGEHLEQPYKTYSAGMSARLQFAVATAIQPQILIVDEVLGAGDTYFMQKSSNRMRRIAESGCTLLLVSHATQQVLQFCDRAIWIEQGRIVMDAPALDVIDAYDVFLERRTVAAKLGRLHDVEQDAKGVEDLAVGLETALSDGRKVYRWSSRPGLKFNRISLGNGTIDNAVFSAGEDIVVDMELIAERDDDFECRYLLTMWSPRGVRVGRAENKIDRFRLRKGQTRSLRAILPKFPVQFGEYLLSLSLYDLSLDQSTRHNEDVRFDVLAHAMRFSVVPRYLSPAYLAELPAVWSLNEQKRTPVAALNTSGGVK
jgi:lipopolysaccharide transport system ATP-binding protein